MSKSKSRFRVSAYDAPERLPLTVKATGGELPPHRIPVIVDGQRRGHVSARTGSASTALRLGAQRARLGTHEGKPAWIGVSGRGSTGGERLAAQRRQAKGSVTRHPTPPQTSARPKRGH